MAAYSGIPLVKKLGIKEGFTIYTTGAPPNYRTLLKPLPAGIRFVAAMTSTTHMAHIFETDRGRLEARLVSLRKLLAPEAIVWVSWPKKASKVSTTITDHTIRELALPLGLVDIKVCAITEVWSGLKLVIRKRLR